MPLDCCVGMHDLGVFSGASSRPWAGAQQIRLLGWVWVPRASSARSGVPRLQLELPHTAATAATRTSCWCGSAARSKPCWVGPNQRGKPNEEPGARLYLQQRPVRASTTDEHHPTYGQLLPPGRLPALKVGSIVFWT